MKFQQQHHGPCQAQRHRVSERGYKAGCRCPATVLHMRNLARERERRRRERARREREYLDPVVTERFYRGLPLPRLTIQQRAKIVALATEAGVPRADIADRIGVVPRTVSKIRARLRGENASARRS